MNAKDGCMLAGPALLYIVPKVANPRPSPHGRHAVIQLWLGALRASTKPNFSISPAEVALGSAASDAPRLRSRPYLRTMAVRRNRNF